MPSSRSSIGRLVVLSVVWGSTWMVNDLIRGHGDPLKIAGERYLLAGLMTALAFCRPRVVTHLCSKTDDCVLSRSRVIGICVILGLTMFAIPDLLLVWAAAHGAAAFTPLIYSALPLGLLLASGELRASAIVGIGSMLVVLNGSLSFSGGKLAWVLLIVLAVALQGWSLVFARRNLAAASSLACISGQLLTAALTLLTVAWVEPSSPLQPHAELWTASSLAALCVLACLATAFAYPLYYRLLRHLKPAQIATSEWLQTLIAIAESAILLHQHPGWPMIAAACVLIGCTVLLLRAGSGEPTIALRLSSEA